MSTFVFANYDPNSNGVLDPNIIPDVPLVKFHIETSPVVLLSAATNITDTGLITGLTALPYVPNGVCQVYCYAQTGLAAGLYYARFSSTSSCQLYLDAAGTVTPTGITAAAYAGGTSAAILSQIIIPGGFLGNNGLIDCDSDWVRPSSVNTMFAGCRLGTAVMQTSNSVPVSSFGGRTRHRVRNRNNQKFQLTLHPAGANPGFAGSPSLLQIDTTVDQTWSWIVTPSNTADYCIFEGTILQIYRQA